MIIDWKVSFIMLLIIGGIINSKIKNKTYIVSALLIALVIYILFSNKKTVEGFTAVTDMTGAIRYGVPYTISNNNDADPIFLCMTNDAPYRSFFELYNGTYPYKFFVIEPNVVGGRFNNERNLNENLKNDHYVRYGDKIRIRAFRQVNANHMLLYASNDNNTDARFSDVDSTNTGFTKDFILYHPADEAIKTPILLGSSVRVRLDLAIASPPYLVFNGDRLTTSSTAPTVSKTLQIRDAHGSRFNRNWFNNSVIDFETTDNEPNRVIRLPMPIRVFSFRAPIYSANIKIQPKFKYMGEIINDRVVLQDRGAFFEYSTSTPDIIDEIVVQFFDSTGVRLTTYNDSIGFTKDSLRVNSSLFNRNNFIINGDPIYYSNAFDSTLSKQISNKITFDGNSGRKFNIKANTLPVIKNNMSISFFFKPQLSSKPTETNYILLQKGYMNNDKAPLIYLNQKPSTSTVGGVTENIRLNVAFNVGAGDKIATIEIPKNIENKMYHVCVVATNGIDPNQWKLVRTSYDSSSPNYLINVYTGEYVNDSAVINTIVNDTNNPIDIILDSAFNEKLFVPYKYNIRTEPEVFVYLNGTLAKTMSASITSATIPDRRLRFSAGNISLGNYEIEPSLVKLSPFVGEIKSFKVFNYLLSPDAIFNEAYIQGEYDLLLDKYVSGLDKLNLSITSSLTSTNINLPSYYTIPLNKEYVVDANKLPYSVDNSFFTHFWLWIDAIDESAVTSDSRKMIIQKGNFNPSADDSVNADKFVWAFYIERDTTTKKTYLKLKVNTTSVSTPVLNTTSIEVPILNTPLQLSPNNNTPNIDENVIKFLPNLKTDLSKGWMFCSLYHNVETNKVVVDVRDASLNSMSKMEIIANIPAGQSLSNINMYDIKFGDDKNSYNSKVFGIHYLNYYNSTDLGSLSLYDVAHPEEPLNMFVNENVRNRMCTNTIIPATQPFLCRNLKDYLLMERLQSSMETKISTIVEKLQVRAINYVKNKDYTYQSSSNQNVLIPQKDLRIFSSVCYGSLSDALSQNIITQSSNTGLRCLPDAPSSCPVKNINDFPIQSHKDFYKYVEASKIQSCPSSGAASGSTVSQGAASTISALNALPSSPIAQTLAGTSTSVTGTTGVLGSSVTGTGSVTNSGISTSTTGSTVVTTSTGKVYNTADYIKKKDVIKQCPSCDLGALDNPNDPDDDWIRKDKIPCYNCYIR